MTFVPGINIGGIAGWRFLERAGAIQQEAFVRASPVRREVEYFKAKIGSIASVAALASDHTLWKVALGAFGLDDEAGKKFFLKKVLGEGTDNPDSFANRLVDTRYRDMARFFGFGNFGGPSTGTSGFGEQIAARYESLQFEKAVGATNNDLRLAMVFRREIGELANSQTSPKTSWFRAMGNLPMRRFLEQALNVPKQVAILDLDRQRDIFQEHLQRAVGSGSLTTLKDPAKRDRLVQLFFFQSSNTAINVSAATGSAALSILQSINSARI